MGNESLILDLLEWLSPAPRQYQEVMSAWRTSCPRLPIWEDALDARLVAVQKRHVSLTRTGREFLETRRPDLSRRNRDRDDGLELDA